MLSENPRLRLIVILSLALVITFSSAALFYTIRMEQNENRSDFTIVNEPHCETYYHQRSKNTFEFRLRNTSGNPVHIQKVAPSCSCSSAVLSKSDLQNDEELTLRMEVDTGTSRGWKAINVGLHYFVLKGQETSPPESHIMIYPLTLNVNVVPDYEIEERKPQPSGDGKQEISIFVTASGAENVIVLSAVANLPCTKVLEIAEKDKNRIYEIKVKYDPKLYKSGDGQCEILICTNSLNEATHRHVLEYHGK